MEFSTAPTLTELLEEKAQQQPDDLAYTFIYHREGKEKIFSFTFKEVFDEARRIAAELQRMGLKPGQRVLIFSSQTHDNILSLFGTLYAGGIIVIIPPPVDEQKKLRFRSVLKSAKPRFLLCNSFLAPILEKAMYPKYIPNSLMKGLIRIAKGFSLFNIDDGRCDPDDYAPILIDEEDTAVLQYSSGSVSEPKGIMLSHRNILANIRDIAKTAGYPMNEPSVGFAPFFHSIGLVYHGLFNVFVGYNSINMTPPAFMEDPFRLFDIASRYGAFLIAAPNSIYRLCAEVLDPERLKDLNLTAIKAAGNGSEAIDIETLEAFADRMKDTGFSIDTFTPGYGMSETTILVSCQRKPAPVRSVVVEAGKVAENLFIEAGPESADRRNFVSCGEVMESFDVRIVDPEAGTEKAAGEIGEIWVKGPAVAKGYWRNPVETERTFGNRLDGVSGRFLRTGDLGVLHDGHLFVTGRIKELIIVGGRNYYPQDFERETARAPGLKGCASAAFSALVKGSEELVLCIESGLDETDLTSAARGLAETLLRNFGLAPRDIVFVEPESLPRTDNRKIRRVAVKTLYLEGRLPAIRSSGGRTDENGTTSETQDSRNEVETAIFNEIRTGFSLSGTIDPMDNLLEAGLDSLAAARLLFALEKAFGVNLSFTDFAECPTVRGLAERIKVLRSGRTAPTDKTDLKKDVVLSQDICFDSGAVPAYRDPQTLFLTGATGFLGAYLIRDILAESDAKIYCHVRATDAAAGMQRIASNLEYYRLWDESMRDRITPIVGDLTRPALGMAPDDYRLVAEDADIVLHNGAYLNFLYPYEMMKAANVEATEEAIQLCATGKPKRLAYVSSYSVFDAPSYFEKTIDETVDASVCEGFLLGYSQTKWVSEQRITLAMERGLDAIVLRPGQITGDTTNGIWKVADFASQFLVSSLQLGMIPDLDVFVPMTPVDYISRAIVALIRQDGPVKNYHLLNTEEQTVGDLTSFFAGAGLNVRRVPFDDWRTAFTAHGEDNVLYYFRDLIGRKDSSETGFFDRYSRRQAKVLATHTEAALGPLGITCPGIDPDLMGKYLQSFKAQGVI